MRRQTATVCVVGIVAIACAGSAARSPSLEADVEAFYADWENEVREAVQDLDEANRKQLLYVMPVAEFEGETSEVLRILGTRPSLRPMVRRLERFLAFDPSNRVRSEIRTEPGDRRLWHILLDTINAELGRPST